MTDLEKLKTVFDEIGVEYTHHLNKSFDHFIMTGEDNSDVCDGDLVSINFKDGKFTHID